MAVLGYARVGTDHQSLDQQHDALTAVGVDRTFIDKMSGTRDDRPGLAALLDYARGGETPWWWSRWTGWAGPWPGSCAPSRP